MSEDLNLPSHTDHAVTETCKSNQPRQYHLECASPNLHYKIGVEKVLETAISDFQKIELIRFTPFGIGLVLDDQVQSCESDEACYHESLVHPAMLVACLGNVDIRIGDVGNAIDGNDIDGEGFSVLNNMECQKRKKLNEKGNHSSGKMCMIPVTNTQINDKIGLRVFIGGGGEGATAREVLKYRCVEKVVMVDLDQKVVEFARKHMKSWNEGVFEDPRFECYYQDAETWLREYPGERFDVIIMDICDPLVCAPGWNMYTKEFYATMVESYLSPEGVFVTQSTSVDTSYPGNPEMKDPYLVIRRTLQSIFGNENVFSYYAVVQSFLYPWGFNIATSNIVSLKKLFRDFSKEETDSLILKSIGEENMTKLRHYDGETQVSMSNLPRAIRSRISEEEAKGEIFTIHKPIFCQRDHGI